MTSVFKPEGRATGTRAKYDAEIPCVQMHCQLISVVAVWCPEVHAKAFVLTMVDMDTGYVEVLLVSGKSPEIFMVKSTALFVDTLTAERTRLRCDNELAMRQLAQKIATVRHPSTTILEPLNRAEHQKCCRSMQRGYTIDPSLKIIEAELSGKSERARAKKVLFMEACMIRVPIDPVGLRRQLDG